MKVKPKLYNLLQVYLVKYSILAQRMRDSGIVVAINKDPDALIYPSAELWNSRRTFTQSITKN